MARKLTYYEKKKSICPICKHSFKCENILSGGGRFNAGDLDVELHRHFLPTQEFGEVHPLLYSFMTCSECYYSTLSSDFEDDEKIDVLMQEALFSEKKTRLEYVTSIFGEIDFTQPKDLRIGAASSFLALLCYEKLPSTFSPLYKAGLSALRGAWLLRALSKETQDKDFSYVALLCYNKAAFFFRRALDLEGKGSLENVKNFGPDIDKDYGYNSLIYLNAYLKYKYGLSEEPKLRRDEYNECLIFLAKIVDMKKVDKMKPTPIIERSSELYFTIKDAMKDEGL